MLSVRLLHLYERDFTGLLTHDRYGMEGENRWPV